MVLSSQHDCFGNDRTSGVGYYICDLSISLFELYFDPHEVDERAVLRHFDWPEMKADTLREAAFGFRNLNKLEYEVSTYQDDPKML
ncbi:hypothetical protein Vadar_023875 [Vaccinium darrowii]|uniref:Uncharacterized protein n=1 Tax=Vaccinium darrowii TaxID=229202 RepID=A0ACB7YXQ6_9ERIC|nr:hypothetical protein Vadar_023875 [Vaccinium darrowii]